MNPAEEIDGGRRRHGEAHSKKTWKRCVSAGMGPKESPATETNGDSSSPGAPLGTAGTSLKCHKICQNYCPLMSTLIADI